MTALVTLSLILAVLLVFSALVNIGMIVALGRVGKHIRELEGHPPVPRREGPPR